MTPNSRKPLATAGGFRFALSLWASLPGPSFDPVRPQLGQLSGEKIFEPTCGRAELVDLNPGGRELTI